MSNQNFKNFFSNKVVRFSIFIFVLTLSVGVLYHMVISNKEILLSTHFTINYLLLLVTLPIYIIASLFTGFIWGKMMNSFGVNIPIYQHIVIYVATGFIGRLPGGVWNVLGRIAWYDQLGVKKRITTSVSVFQWFLIIWSGLIIMLIVLPMAVKIDIEKIIIIIISILLLSFLFNPRLLRWILRNLIKDPLIEDISYRSVAFWVIIYLIIWFLGGTILFLVVNSIYPGKVSLFTSLSAWSAGSVSGTLMTFLPSGLGLTEAVTSLLLSIQIPSSISVISSLVIRILLTIYDFLLSSFFFLCAKRLLSIKRKNFNPKVL